MGNLMFKESGDETGGDGGHEKNKKRVATDCTIIDFHSAQFLSPATDLAHLLLTSTTREYRQKHWDEVIESYYETFNRTLAEFGLILRHLGTTYNDFLYEVKRALRGQFLCVAFIIPIGKHVKYQT
jgi:thiamine kinase-like enzyme